LPFLQLYRTDNGLALASGATCCTDTWNSTTAVTATNFVDYVAITVADDGTCTVAPT
jgi:hypothetical protein